MEADDLAWIRARARHAARLYDGFRLDHVVGYFRQWVKAEGRERSAGILDPEGGRTRRRAYGGVLGAVLEELAQANHVEPPRALAEDLGVIPPFVRDVLRELAMPGYRETAVGEGRRRTLPRSALVPGGQHGLGSTHDTAPPSWLGGTSCPRKTARPSGARAGVEPGMDPPARTMVLLRDLYGASSTLALVLSQELPRAARAHQHPLPPSGRRTGAGACRSPSRTWSAIPP